ncbi:MAG: hypothetical protein FWF07_04815 [Methanomassiliicoccaceae archaeon]|nr:hypothetical protein [Methanomassiliicoccaceae archaeon]
MAFVVRTLDGFSSEVDNTLKERDIIKNDNTSNGALPSDDPGIRTLDNVGLRSLVKIYCACGKIVDLDRKNMNIKKSLKKDLECTACRNTRVGKDIDLLNTQYDRSISIEEDPIY